MKKKLLTTALATTMTVASVCTAMADTVTSLDNTAGWANPSNAGMESLTGDFDVTYKFTIDSVGKDNWNNFVIELRTGETDNWDYLDIRADAFAFTNGPKFGASFDNPSTSVLEAAWTVPEGHVWEDWLASCKGATVEANLVRTGDVFTYKAAFSFGTVFTSTFKFGSVDVPDTVELTMFGDGASFSNISFTNNKPAETTPPETTAPDKSVATSDGKVSVGYAEGVIPDGATFEASKVESGEAFDGAKKLVEGKFEAGRVFNVYDFTLKNGDAVLSKLDGKVTVSLDAPFTPASGRTIVVYRVDGESLVKCETTYKDGKVAFETDHFSTYVFVEEEVTPTGDLVNVTLLVGMALVAGAAVVCRKKSVTE